MTTRTDTTSIENSGDDAYASHQHERDLNLRSDQLHVLADALTSVLAIVALMAGKLFGAWWMDSLIGVVGAVLVTRWAWGLLRDTTALLLDHQAPDPTRQAVREAIQSAADNRLYNLHIWRVAPGTCAAILGVVDP